MDVVYVFFDSEKARIPFYDFDKKLFSKFSGSALGGRWDDGKARRDCAYQYVIPLLNYDKNIVERLCGGKPFIEIDKDRRYPVIVNCFFSREIAVPEKPPAHGRIADDSAHDLFSDFWRGQLDAEMRVRKYSANTRAAYIFHNRALCRHAEKSPEKIDTDDIKKYLSHKEGTDRFSASSLNLALSAFKFFYGTVLKKDVAQTQKRPRQDKRLPIVLSKAEIKKIIDAESNLKHRLLLMMVYASGLRVSEVVRLKRGDVDTARKTVRVYSGKGRKDRYTILSELVIPLFEHYCARYRITGWIFPGADSGDHLSIRTAQRICELALEKANIHKAASIHSLRHTFATHLLENGTDISYIKELLGHASVHTTERYIHVAKRKTLKIASPLDTLDKGD